MTSDCSEFLTKVFQDMGNNKTWFMDKELKMGLVKSHQCRIMSLQRSIPLSVMPGCFTFIVLSALDRTKPILILDIKFVV